MDKIRIERSLAEMIERTWRAKLGDPGPDNVVHGLVKLRLALAQPSPAQDEQQEPSVNELALLRMGLAQACAERDQLRAEVEALRKAFGECIQSLHDEMLQSYGGQLPNDMHPVTRRNYDRDMAEIAEYRAAMAATEDA